MTRFAFIAAAFFASALLFAVQPMVVRMLLPSLGGSPAVWNTGMVFFQILLLAGYLFAHGSFRWLSTGRQRIPYAVLLLTPLLVLPVTLPAGWLPPADSDPTLWTLAVLGAMVGLPYLALATVSPTLQTWYALRAGSTGGEPYMLYAAGNAGSVLALLGYPFLAEPLLGLTDQALWWAAGYTGTLALIAICAFSIPPGASVRPVAVTGAPDWGSRFRWMAYAAVPSALLLGVTRHIGDEIASFPLLWILPLTLYLATFILTFGSLGARLLAPAGRLARLLIIPALLSMFRIPVPLALVVVVHLALFSALALVLHQKLYASRPAPDSGRLTEFYVFLSLGGALGGMFVALVAPLLFSAIYEYPLAVALALLALPRDPGAPGWIQRLRESRSGSAASLVAVLLAAVVVGAMVARSDLIDSTALEARLLAGVAGVAAYLLIDRPKPFALAISALLLAGVVVKPTGTVLQERSFFGVLRVQDIGAKTVMVHGTTVHGSQDRRIPKVPQGYYHPEGPAGATLAHLAESGQARSVGLVGLGVGALAAVSSAGDELTFYEIDPNVVRVAKDVRRFTYVSDSAAKIKTVVGDGRLNLQRLGARHDLLVIDAFSGDAIPVHLLTREAFALYGETVSGGPVLIHISNRHLDLAFVVAATAMAAGMDAWIWEYAPLAQAQATGAVASRWMLLAAPGSRPPPGDWWPLKSDLPAWTDDYSNIVGAIGLQ